MWLPILGNFLNIIFVIFCIFGVNQRKPNYMYSYCVWSLVWVAWNTFVTCYYMEVGSLDREEDVLSLGTNSFSWWLANGYGCRPVYYHNISNELIIDAMERNGNAYHPLRPSEVNGCLMEYYYVEVIHAGVQVVLAVLGMAASIYLVYLIVSERQKRQGTPQKGTPLYSIEYSPQVNETAMVGAGPDNELYANAAAMKENQGHMTPRRVKRRSYTRNSARSAKSLNRAKRSSAANRAYSSMKIPRGSKSTPSGSINPVTRLMDLDPIAHARQRSGATAAAAAAGLDSSTSNDVEQAYGQVNPAYESSRPNSIYSSSTANGNGIVSRQPGGAGGGGGPERPPSALTSYSNFHGQRKQAPNHFAGINLTQDTLVQPPPPPPQNQTNPSGGGDGGQNAMLPINHLNSSFDDLPPPPPPIAEDADVAAPSSTAAKSAPGRPQAPLPAAPSPSLAGVPQSSPRLPVPQQRNPVTREPRQYVNMPVIQRHSMAPPAQVQEQRQQQPPPPPQQQRQQHLDSSPSSDVNIYNDDPNNMQTLRANDRLILPPPRNASTENSTRYYKSAADTPDASTGARAKQYNGYGGGASAQNDRIPNGRPPARPPTGLRNGYGFSGGGGGMHHQDRALPPQPNSLSNGNPSSEDDYGFTSLPAVAKPQRPNPSAKEHDYMRDPMKPVGAQMHGGNCKCYRCQRKLTAI